MKEFNLDKEPKIRAGFKVPDAYFDHLSAKVLDQLSIDESEVIPIYTRKKNWIYAAAAILVISLSIPLATHFKKSTTALDSAALENYLATRSSITTEDIAENLTIEDIQKIKINSNIEDQAIEDFLSTNSNLEEDIVN